MSNRTTAECASSETWPALWLSSGERTFVTSSVFAIVLATSRITAMKPGSLAVCFEL
jgi:hypothetical protein